MAEFEKKFFSFPTKAVHSRLDLCAIRTQYNFCNLYDLCDTRDTSSAHGGRSD